MKKRVLCNASQDSPSGFPRVFYQQYYLWNFQHILEFLDFCVRFKAILNFWKFRLYFYQQTGTKSSPVRKMAKEKRKMAFTERTKTSIIQQITDVYLPMFYIEIEKEDGCLF